MISFREDTNTQTYLDEIVKLMNEFEKLTDIGTLVKDRSHIIRVAIFKEYQDWYEKVEKLKSK